jgi:hypothetical protein
VKIRLHRARQALRTLIAEAAAPGDVEAQVRREGGGGSRAAHDAR